MIYFWYRAFWVLIARNFQKPLSVEDDFVQNFRVGLFDCEGFRIMSAFKYANYLDYNRWEFVVRTSLFKEIYLKGCSTALGSQKIIYRKPLKIWSRFTLRLQTVGWDEKWVYNIQQFEQDSEIKAICVSRSLVWKKSKPQILHEMLANIGVKDLEKQPPTWVKAVFENDAQMISKDL